MSMFSIQQRISGRIDDADGAGTSVVVAGVDVDDVDVDAVAVVVAAMGVDVLVGDQHPPADGLHDRSPPYSPPWTKCDEEMMYEDAAMAAGTGAVDDSSGVEYPIGIEVAVVVVSNATCLSTAADGS